MSDEPEELEEVVGVEKEADPLDGMAPEVRRCLERGNEIRQVKAEIGADLEQFSLDLLELYPGHEDMIRKGFEGAAASLLAKRDERKRNERNAKGIAAKEAKRLAAENGGSDGSGENSGANGVSGTVHSLHAGDPGGGEEDQSPKGEAG